MRGWCDLRHEITDGVLRSSSRQMPLQQLLVRRQDLRPRQAVLEPTHAVDLHRLQIFRRQVGHQRIEAVRIREIPGTLTRHPAIEPVVMRKNSIARTQRLNQRRVRAAHLMAMHIGSTVEADGLHDRLVIDGTHELHLFAGGIQHSLVKRVRRVIPAKHHELKAAPTA